MPTLDYITLENYRCFGRKQRFDFADLTLLVGPNSSGKSSLIRMLGMLAASASITTENGGIFRLQAGPDTPVKELFTNGNIKEPIKVTLPSRIWNHKVDLEISYSITSKSKVYLEATSIVIQKNDLIIYSFKQKNNKVEFSVNWPVFLYLLHRKAKIISSQFIRKKELYDIWNQAIDDIEINYKLIQLLREIDPNAIIPDEEFIDLNTFLNLYHNYIIEFIDPEDDYEVSKAVTGEESIRIMEIFQSYNFTNDGNRINDFADMADTLFNYKKNKINKINTIKNQCSIIDNHQYISSESALPHLFSLKTKDDFSSVKNAILYFTSNAIKNSLYNINWKLKDFYSFRGGLVTPNMVFNQLDENFGSKLANFNTAVTEIPQYNKFINQALQLFDLGESINIQKQKKGYSIDIIQKGQRIPLHMLGYGITQIISLIVHLILFTDSAAYKMKLGKAISWGEDEEETDNNDQVEENALWGSNDLTLLIEEPESNLHPAFQSKLADLFKLALDLLHSKDIMQASNNKPCISFIIETHSEYMVRKLQLLVCNQMFNAEKAAIHYFPSKEYKNELGKNPFKITIHPKYGTLSSVFGPGFYDESDNLINAIQDSLN